MDYMYYYCFIDSNYETVEINKHRSGNTCGRLYKLTVSLDFDRGTTAGLISTTKTSQPRTYHSMDSGNEKRKEEREEEEIEEKVEGEFSTQHSYPQSLTFLRDLNTSILTIALSPISYHVYNCICHTGGAAVDEVKSDEEEELLEETKRSTKGERKRRRTETTETVSNHDSSSGKSLISKKRSDQTLRTRRTKISTVLPLRALNSNMTAHQSLSSPISATYEPITRVTLMSLSIGTSDGSRDVTLDESFEVGVKRERMGTEKGKRSRQHRSEEARMRRRTAAKERYKQNKLRRRLERASLNSPVKQPGESRKSPTTDGTPRSNLDRPASEGSGDVHRNPSGPGNQPPQAEPDKKLREEGPRSEGKRTSKDSACPPSKNPPPTKKPAGADAKPPRSGKRGARRGRPARPSGHPHHLYLRIEGTETATEVQRRSLMEYMAVTIASRPTSSTTRPVFITDSRLEPNGSIRLTGPDQETADNIREILEARGDVRFTEGPGVLRRFVFGGPGYLNNMTPEQIQGLLENQNPGLPQGSIRVVSVDTSGKNPLFFVEITEEGHAFLKERDFLLDSITSQMFFRPAGGKKRKDGSPDH